MSGRRLPFHETQFEQNRFTVGRIASGHGAENTIMRFWFRVAILTDSSGIASASEFAREFHRYELAE